MLANFDRYLKNTTIFEYKNEDKNVHHKMNQDYNPIKINWINFFSVQSFFQFIDSIIKKYKIKTNGDLWKNIYAIYWYVVEKKNITDTNELDCIKSIFVNLNLFLEKVVIWKKIDEFWPIPSYTNTDAKNVYCSIWNDTIKRIFEWNRNIEKIRQTRNKFIEHNEDHKIDKLKNDFRRKVSLIWWWDNSIWRINMKIDIISENKTYKFCLCPLLDFCVFIDELLKIKKKKHPLQERKIYADLIRYTRTITQHIQSVHAKKCARQTRMERCV